MPSPERNAIVVLLRKSRRHLGPEDVVAVLGAISQVGEGPFSLRELRKYLPERMVSKRNVMRSVGALLQTLVSLGYLERFSERRYRKRYESFSHYMMSQVMELANLEASTVQAQRREEKVLKVLGSKKQGRMD
jgi:DNA-binding IclR family transcriptional regulator